MLTTTLDTSLDGQYVAAEANGDVHLGTVTVDTAAQTVILRTGQRGRPIVLSWDEIDLMVPAEQYPGAEVTEG